MTGSALMGRDKVRYLIAKGSLNYWQPSAKMIKQGWLARRLSDDPLIAGQEAMIQNAKLDDWRAEQKTGRRGKRRDGSLGELIHDYKASAYFKEQIRPKTRKSYDWALGILDAWAKDTPVRALTARACRRFYDEMAKRTPAKAALTMRVLRRILTVSNLLYAPHEAGFFPGARGSDGEAGAGNPAGGLSIKNQAAKGKLWLPAAVKAYVAAADALGLHSLGTAVMLNEWMGQREGDLIAAPWAEYRDGVIRLVQSKTGAWVEIAVGMVPHLVTRLEAEKKRQADWAAQPLTIIAFEKTCRPYNEHTFRHEFSRVRELAVTGDPELGLEPCPEVEGLIFMWLRHTAIAHMAESGASTEEIAGVTGHALATAQGIIDRYLVRTRKLAQGAFAKRLEAEAR